MALSFTIIIVSQFLVSEKLGSLVFLFNNERTWFMIPQQANWWNLLIYAII
jgi:hypothetical protein